MLGSAIISAAKDGVDRFGTPSNGGVGASGGSIASSSPGTLSPSGGESGNGDGYSYAGNLNENLNLKNIGKFFRRDLGGLGGRFGRGGEEGG